MKEKKSKKKGFRKFVNVARNNFSVGVGMKV